MWKYEIQKKKPQIKWALNLGYASSKGLFQNTYC